MNSIETKYIEQDELGQKWLRLNYDSGAAVTALPIAIAGDLPLEKCGEFRVASGATIPNFGKIKMKSTDESGIERTLQGNITGVSKPLLSAAEVSKRWDSLLFEDGGILLEQSSAVALEIRAVSWQSTKFGVVVAGASGSTARATCTMHMCELAMSHRSLHQSNQQRRAGRGWKLTMDNATSRRNLRINLKSSGECWKLVSTQSWRGRSTLITLCSHFCARCVCKSERNKSTAWETDEQGIGEARTTRTQNLPRILLHVRGRSFDADACVEIQQIREDVCHSFGTERIDAVRSEVLCRVPQANWSSNVHQQE